MKRLHDLALPPFSVCCFPLGDASRFGANRCGVGDSRHRLVADGFSLPCFEFRFPRWDRRRVGIIDLHLE